MKLNMDKDNTPNVRPPRRIPFHIPEDVKHALEELQQQDMMYETFLLWQTTAENTLKTLLL